MSAKTVAVRIIAALNRNDPLAQCQECSRSFHLHRAGLFFVTKLTADAKMQLTIWKNDFRSEQIDLRERRKHISEGSQAGAKAVNIGFTLETLAPALPTFPLDRRDCRPLGDPIDFIVFENLARRGRVDRIILGDVKTGSARLSDRQKSIRTAVEQKRLEWDVYAD